MCLLAPDDLTNETEVRSSELGDVLEVDDDFSPCAP